MACLPNIQTLVNLDFSAVNDAPNWTTNSLFPVATVGGQLVLNPSATSSTFVRELATPDPTNNRLRLRSNFELDANTAGSDTATIKYEIINGLEVICSGCAEFVGVDNNTYKYQLDRTLKIVAGTITAPLFLRISMPVGWEYIIRVDDLVVEDFFYCADNVRSYFVFENFFNLSRTALSAAVQLISWKVGGAETLTPAFFAENNIVGSDPSATYAFASADLDGTNRVADPVTPNTFNPFFNDWGLDFDNSPGNFLGGKTTGTISGSDYGSAILGTGVLYPQILDGNLNGQRGAFFIDIDFEQDLLIEIDVIVNPSNTNVFVDPTYWRKYFISFDATTCVKRFYYIDQLAGTGVEVDVNELGFLYGITTQIADDIILPCDSSYQPVSMQGNTVLTIDFGADVGIAGINYEAFGIPDRFILEWNGGVVIDTGFVGSDAYDTALLNTGVLPGDINTTPGGSGTGQATFNKTLASPNTATLTVLAPLDPNGWNVLPLCVGSIPPTCDIVSDKASGQIDETFTFTLTAADVDGTITSWLVDFGDGTTTGAAGVPPASVAHDYDSIGGKIITFTVVDNDGNSCVSTVNVAVAVQRPPIGNINEFSDECYTCLQFTVTVPAGETWSVESISAFGTNGGYAGGAPAGCFTSPDDGQRIAIDGVVNISETTTFVTGIDAASQANNTQTSSITIVVKDGSAQFQGQYVITRNHVAANC